MVLHIFTDTEKYLYLNIWKQCKEGINKQEEDGYARIYTKYHNNNNNNTKPCKLKQ